MNIGYIQKMCCGLHSMLVTASALRAAVGDQWLGGAAHLAPASCWPLAAVDTGPGTKSKKAARWRTGAGGGEWCPAHADGQQQLSRKLETREETSPHSPSQDTIFILFYPRPPVSQSWSSSFTSLYFSWSSFQPLYKLKGG